MDRMIMEEHAASPYWMDTGEPEDEAEYRFGEYVFGEYRAAVCFRYLR